MGRQYDHQGVSAQNWPRRGQLTPHLETYLIHLSQKERTLSRLSRALSPGIIEGRGFVLNRVLGFIIDKRRLVCQD